MAEHFSNSSICEPKDGESEASLCYTMSTRFCLKETNKMLQKLYRVETLRVDTKFVFLHSPLNMRSTLCSAGGW